MNGFYQIPRTPSLLGTVAEECPQGGYDVVNGDTSPSPAAPKSKIGINIAGMNAGELPSDWTIPTKKSPDCSANLRDTAIKLQICIYGKRVRDFHFKDYHPGVGKQVAEKRLGLLSSCEPRARLNML